VSDAADAGEASEAGGRPTRSKSTATQSFGAGRRESHDATAFYERFTPPVISDDDDVRRHDVPAAVLESPCRHGDARDMADLPDGSVALVVTSPPYFVGKDYEQIVTGGDDAIPTSYLEYLQMLHDVFAECVRVLEPGGRIAVNVANLGRKPYRSLSGDVIKILQDDLGLLLRGEIIWQKAEGASGSVAWGSFRSPANPVLRDLTERVIVASKGRFDRALSAPSRRKAGLPSEATLPNDEFVETTLDVWKMQAESATRIGHPAPFPVELPRRLIELYTYADDVVLDPFMGSGTTLVAAERTGRAGVGFDLDPEFVALAEARLARERERGTRLRAVRGEQGSFDLGEIDLSDLDDDERQDHFQARAVKEGKKAHDIAERILTEAGFVVDAVKAKVSAAGVQFNFRVTSADGGNEFYVDVSGAFTTVRPGLMRTDTLWKTLGRIHALHGVDPDARVLVLTSNLPRRGSEGDKAMRAVGPAAVFDAIEMFDPTALDRLVAYGTDGVRDCLEGFWDAADLDRL
jgi:site-specific DNA-methyltransferase (adenine-specific)